MSAARQMALEQMHASRAEQRKQRLIEAEMEQAAEEAEALHMTEEQRQLLMKPFATVKAEFADLDGLRWTQTALRKLQPRRTATHLAPSSAASSTANSTSNTFVVLTNADLASFSTDDTIRVSSSASSSRPPFPSLLSYTHPLSPSSVSAPPLPTPDPPYRHRDGTHARSPIKGLFPPTQPQPQHPSPSPSRPGYVHDPLTETTRGDCSERRPFPVGADDVGGKSEASVVGTSASAGVRMERLTPNGLRISDCALRGLGVDDDEEEEQEEEEEEFEEEEFAESEDDDAGDDDDTEDDLSSSTSTLTSSSFRRRMHPRARLELELELPAPPGLTPAPTYTYTPELSSPPDTPSPLRPRSYLHTDTDTDAEEDDDDDDGDLGSLLRPPPSGSGFAVPLPSTLPPPRSIIDLLIDSPPTSSSSSSSLPSASAHANPTRISSHAYDNTSSSFAQTTSSSFPSDSAYAIPTRPASHAYNTTLSSALPYNATTATTIANTRTGTRSNYGSATPSPSTASPRTRLLALLEDEKAGRHNFPDASYSYDSRKGRGGKEKEAGEKEGSQQRGRKAGRGGRSGSRSGRGRGQEGDRENKRGGVGGYAEASSPATAASLDLGLDAESTQRKSAWDALLEDARILDASSAGASISKSVRVAEGGARKESARRKSALAALLEDGALTAASSATISASKIVLTPSVVGLDSGGTQHKSSWATLQEPPASSASASASASALKSVRSAEKEKEKKRDEEENASQSPYNREQRVFLSPGTSTSSLLSSAEEAAGGGAWSGEGRTASPSSSTPSQRTRTDTPPRLARVLTESDGPARPLSQSSSTPSKRQVPENDETLLGVDVIDTLPIYSTPAPAPTPSSASAHIQVQTTSHSHSHLQYQQHQRHVHSRANSNSHAHAHAISRQHPNPLSLSLSHLQLHSHSHSRQHSQHLYTSSSHEGYDEHEFYDDDETPTTSPVDDRDGDTVHVSQIMFSRAAYT